MNYFRVSDFQRLFGVVHESGHLFGGQYIYVEADLSTIRTPVCTKDHHFEFPKDFLGTVSKYALHFNRKKLLQSAIWGGAASKGLEFAIFQLRYGAKVSYVIDTKPGKHGKYLPGSGIKVSSPNDALKELQSSS